MISLVYWWMFPISMAIATSAMTFGIGGAVFFSPIFIILFPIANVPTLTPATAFGAALLTELVGFASGFVGYGYRKTIDYKTGGMLCSMAVPMTVMATMIKHRVPPNILLSLFSGVMFALALFTWYHIYVHKVIKRPIVPFNKNNTHNNTDHDASSSSNHTTNRDPNANTNTTPFLTPPNAPQNSYSHASHDNGHSSAVIPSLPAPRLLIGGGGGSVGSAHDTYQPVSNAEAIASDDMSARSRKHDSEDAGDAEDGGAEESPQQEQSAHDSRGVLSRSDYEIAGDRDEEHAQHQTQTHDGHKMRRHKRPMQKKQKKQKKQRPPANASMQAKVINLKEYNDSLLGRSRLCNLMFARKIIDRQGNIYIYNVCRPVLGMMLITLGAIMTGLMSVGIGETVVTTLRGRCQLPMHIATGTSVLVVTVVVLASSLTDIVVEGIHGVPWTLVMFTMPGVLIGGQIGPYVAHKVNAAKTEKMLVVLFLILGAAMTLITLHDFGVIKEF